MKSSPTRRHRADQGQRRWLFGKSSLDESSLELRVEGKPVSIERKPLEVLVHLLHHAGEVVTKDELTAAVWPGRVVSDTVVAKAVGKLREALSDTSQELIKTVHGYGYRLDGKVAVEQQRASPTAHFSFKPGDHPPGRPLWSLVQRLGAGGQGEAWLATHDKTHEQRVFKFAIDQTSLAALKREITLFRFLNDSLGEQARIVTLRDWNFEQSPYFLEADYVSGGSLADWVERNGGLSAISLATRLDIAIQIAEALSAVHSVGVLHKDLKPSNVLIKAGGTPHILLADFGSGGVTDVRRLEALGITRMGFTKSIAALNDRSAGTPAYLAPEILAGQPPTVKGDIYALGVMLYQLVVGEFRRGMSAGWERHVDDELLRECISDAAQGDVAHRLGDVALLAQRLRNLDEERKKRRQDEEARQRAKQLEHALAMAKSSQAVADFLTRDLFAVVGSRPLRDLTVRELLQAASEKLSHRFADLPLAAAQIHAALGSAFWTMECMDEARSHLDEALTLLEQQEMGGSELMMRIAGQLMTVEFHVGKGLANLARFEAVLDAGQKDLGPGDANVLGLRQQIAWVRFGSGEWRRTAEELQQLIDDASKASVASVLETAPIQLGRVLISLGSYPAALTILTDARARLLKSHGPRHVVNAQLHALLGVLFTRMERFEEADLELSKAENLLAEWTADDAAVQLVSIRYIRGQLLLAQGNAKEAISTLESVLSDVEKLAWMRQSGLIGEIESWLARAYLAAGRLDRAVSTMRSALSVGEVAFGPQHPQSLAARIGLAEIVRRHQGPTEARAVLAKVDRRALAELGNDHPLAAEMLRVEGLVSATEGNTRQATMALCGALRICETSLGRSHALSTQLRTDLALVASAKR